MQPLGGCGGMLPRKIFNFRKSEIDSGALSDKKCDFCMVEIESSFASAESLCA